MRTSIVSAALAWIACTSAASAHHSISMFDLGKPIWIEGTVVRLEPVNPHVVFAFEQRTEDGKVQLWTVEGPGVNSFKRMTLGNDFLKPGDFVEVCGFTYKAEVAARFARDGSSRPNLHGHVLHMPDGHMLRFGGYGKIENCIRPNDGVQQWVDFLETDRGAHESWCAGRGSLWTSFPSVAPTGFVDEVDRLLSNPCGE